ncbi:response regulator [Caballeronia sp. LZ016]|uniref:response regulator n=1 Tax=Caballeronia sp. LZ016 TaxID=3038554 RepID=UPI00285D9810|nr:response regulator [Caballeronia sp. LZ016]MDR5740006.1 response regulator [Caballeronia sp. LZ016]
MQRPILLADDSEADRELALIAFERSGITNRVIAVADGKEALEFLNREGRWANRERVPPAFVMLDLKMPIVDGFAVLTAMQRSPFLRHIPVVVLTSSRREEDLVRAYNHGANAYVVKPIEFPEFERAIFDLGRMWGMLNVPPPALPV